MLCLSVLVFNPFIYISTDCLTQCVYASCTYASVSGPAAVLAFLRAELRCAEACRLMKLMFVGPPRQGKSALLEALQTGRNSPFSPSDRSIRTSSWILERPSGVKNTVKNHTHFINSKCVYSGSVFRSHNVIC